MSRVLLPLAVATILAIAVSCYQGLPDAIGCNDIPDGGCPTDRGGSCDDPACAAIYTCNDGIWSFAQKCAPIEAGAGGGP